MITNELLTKALQSNDPELIRLAYTAIRNPLYTFKPRPDNPAQFDQQTSFVNDRFSGWAVVLGGTGCLAGETQIYDPVAGEYKQLDEIKEPFHVWSRRTNGTRTVGIANKPYLKGVLDLYEVCLSNGKTFTCTLDHRVLTKEKEWKPLKELAAGAALTGALIEKVTWVRWNNYYDFTVEPYHNYELAGAWHHNSGKTYAGSYKLAKFLMQTPPPVPKTPFWIVAQSLDMVTQRLWVENLSQFITDDMIARISYYNQTTGAAKSVVLKPDKKGNSWMLEFMAYDQGRQRLQAANIAGAWLDEQCPMLLLEEVWGRIRKWEIPGNKWYTLTPLEYDPELEHIYHKREEHPAFKFYRMNQDLNTALSAHYREHYLENVCEELQDTRRIGAFGSYSGVIYKSFRDEVHVINEDNWNPPAEWTRIMGIDYGFSHPTVALFCAKDHDGRYFIYDEYYQNQTCISDHVEAIKRKMGSLKFVIYSDYAAAQERFEFSKEGLGSFGAHKDVKMGIAKVQAALKVQLDRRPKLYIHRRCSHLLEEMRTYSWSKVIPDKPIDINNDCCDSLRYIIASDRYQEIKHTKPFMPHKSPARLVHF